MTVKDKFIKAISTIKKGDTCPECGEPCLINGRCYKCESKVKFYHSETAYELQKRQNRIIYKSFRKGVVTHGKI